MGKTEVERMARMTDLAMAAAEIDPAAFQESFDEIGMNIEDPTLFQRPVEGSLFSEPALTGYNREVETNPSILQESLKTRVDNEEPTLLRNAGLISNEASSSASDGAVKSTAVDSAWVISIKSPLGAQAVRLRFFHPGQPVHGDAGEQIGLRRHLRWESGWSCINMVFDH